MGSTVQLIDEKSPYFVDVINLWRKSRSTLGLMPEGGFIDYAQSSGLAVILDDEGKCCGYTLFRKVRDRLAIAHFCIAEESRGKGLAYLLRDWLLEQAQITKGIILSCRTDFPVNKIWPKLAFVPINRKQGRAGQLTIWFLSNNQRTLFSSSHERDALQAVFDANVFIDLMEDKNEETLQLKADWIVPYLSLHYTHELLIDLDRDKSKRAEDSIAYLKREYECLECSAEEYKRTEALLKSLAPTSGREQDESDFRHLVRACACSAEVFVTRDDKLLSAHEKIKQICGLSVVRPAELTTRIDSIINEHLYRRDQISGANEIVDVRMVAVDPQVADTILAPGEGKHALIKILEAFLSKPLEYECHLVSDAEGAILACYVLDNRDKYLRVPVFRIRKNKRAVSLSRSLLAKFTRQAVKAGMSGVVVADKTCEKAAFLSQGYIDSSAGYLKLIVRGWLAAEEISKQVDWPGPETVAIQAMLAESTENPIVAKEIEHLLWPVKISDAPLVNYIVAIKPQFAEQLFDHRLASGKMFGVDTDLALNMDSVYYRAARPGLAENARIIWYVKKDSEYTESMSFRACSRVVKVEIGNPKELFKKYERLGVYRFQDVKDTAHGDVGKEIMAFQFDDTELLKPIHDEDFRPLLDKYDIKSTFQSPTQIPPELFGEIYVALFDSSKIC